MLDRHIGLICWMRAFLSWANIHHGLGWDFFGLHAQSPKLGQWKCGENPKLKFTRSLKFLHSVSVNCSTSKSSLKLSKQTTGHIKIAVWFLLTNFDGNVLGGQTVPVLSHPSHAITWFVSCDQSSATLCLEKKSYQRDFQDTYMRLHL